MKRKAIISTVLSVCLSQSIITANTTTLSVFANELSESEFVSSFSDADTRKIAQYLMDNNLSLDDAAGIMETYEIGLSLIEERQTFNSIGIETYSMDLSEIDDISNSESDDDFYTYIDAPFYSDINLASTDHYIAVVNTDMSRNIRGCLDFLFHENYTYYANSTLDFFTTESYVTKLLPVYENSNLSLTYKIVSDGAITGGNIVSLLKLGIGQNAFTESDIRSSIAMVDTSHIGGFEMYTYALGDIDHNGLVDEADSTYLLRFLVQLPVNFIYEDNPGSYYSLANVAAMNFNLDDEISLIDAIALNRYITGNNQGIGDVQE